jgi:mono/diheme cytochrome c family protein
VKKTGRSNILLSLLVLIFVSCGSCTDEKAKQAEILKKGEELYTKYGCAVCHSLDGKMVYGPALNEIYQKETKVVRQGKEYTIVANRDYLIKAIIDPRFEKVSEYRNKDMPIPIFEKEEAEILADYIIEINKMKSGK